VFLRWLRSLAVLCFFAGGALAVSQTPAQTPQGPAGAPGQPPAPVSPTPAQEASAPDSQPSQAPQTHAPAAKPPVDHHVITNDDLKGGGSILYSQHTGIDLSSINDCDRNCFEQVRTAARIPAGPSFQWQRDLLNGIDKIRADAEWQGRLSDLAQVKGRYCDLENAKNEDLAQNSDPKNVTEGEISIEEIYQRKFEALQSDLGSASARADAVRRNYSGIVVGFMVIQQQRIVNATCPNSWRPPARYFPGYYNDVTE
jgi:hypothetical protein